MYTFGLFLNTMTNIVQNLTINRQSIDDSLGIRTWDRRKVSTDKSSEPWWPSNAVGFHSKLKHYFEGGNAMDYRG